MSQPKKKRPPDELVLYVAQVQCSDGTVELKVLEKEEQVAKFLAYMKKHNIQAVAWAL